MPFVTKRCAVARRIAAARRLLRQSAEPAQVQLEMAEWKSEPKDDLQWRPVENGSSLPLEMTFEVGVKPEPIDPETESQFLRQDEVEVKEEFLDSEISGPIEQDRCRSLQESNEESELDDRCQFCLKLFQESGGRGIITKMKVGFVLGLTKWDTVGKPSDCCAECSKMFEMFYEFKQNCLVALARPAELFAWLGNKRSAQSEDSKPNDGAKPRSTKRGQIGKSKTKKCVHTLGESSKLEGLAPEVVSTEAPLIELQQDVKEAVCVICNETVSDGMTLREHLLKHYSEDTNQANIKYQEPVINNKRNCVEPRKRTQKDFACPLCPMKFMYNRELKYHTNKHNNKRTIPCRREGCTKMFCHPNSRWKHENICGQEIQTICSVCGSSFRSKDSLQKHMAIHGYSRFTCEFCDKGFYTMVCLKKHSTVHSDERRFQCKVCDKRFKSHDANRVHQRIHTKEKPYACNICDQRFRYNCLLKTHLKKRHNSG